MCRRFRTDLIETTLVGEDCDVPVIGRATCSNTLSSSYLVYDVGDALVLDILTRGWEDGGYGERNDSRTDREGVLEGRSFDVEPEM